MRLIFDIETGSRPWEEIEAFFPPWEAGRIGECEAYPESGEALRADCEGRAALSALTGRVCAIGILRDPFGPQERITILGNEGNDDAGERRILAAFWQGAEKDFTAAAWDKWNVSAAEPRWIGFNSNSFDIPFMTRRSWALGLAVPAWLLDKERYLHRMFCDLRDRWNFGAHSRPDFHPRTPRQNLDNISRLLGGPVKNGHGEDFARLYYGSAAARAAAVAYLENDLRMTADVWKAMGS
ncbi:MAG: hypothetical protein KA004_19255 [Verrucomicrobiales bacterium]|nr:hypothetical protein [Verrucomicrobiales bacterium]